MSKKSAIATANERIEAILAERKANSDNLVAKTNESREAVIAASHDMESAILSGDIDAYREAKSRKAAAADALEMYTAQAATLGDRPLISKEEYEQLIEGIYSEVSALNAEVQSKAANLAEEMQKAGEQLRSVQGEANKTLHRLQHDIFRDADRTKNIKTGDIIAIRSEEKTVDYWDTINWTLSPVCNEIYEGITGKRATMPVPYRYAKMKTAAGDSASFGEDTEKMYRDAAIEKGLKDLSQQIGASKYV